MILVEQNNPTITLALSINVIMMMPFDDLAFSMSLSSHKSDLVL